MKILITYLVVFLTFCFFGWCLEVCYRSFKLKHFVNPGFMTGPVLPIYGSGVCVLFLVASLSFDNISQEWVKFLIKAIICGVLMTVVEYIAGFISLKFYHNRLWDYSKRWGNIQGIICPTFSLIWTLLGALFIGTLYKPMASFGAFVYENNHLWLILGILYGVFITDLVYSLELMAKLRAEAIKLKTTFNFVQIQQNMLKKARELNNKRVSAWNEFKIRHNIAEFFDKKSNEDNKDKEEIVKESK